MSGNFVHASAAAINGLMMAKFYVVDLDHLDHLPIKSIGYDIFAFKSHNALEQPKDG